MAAHPSVQQTRCGRWQTLKVDENVLRAIVCNVRSVGARIFVIWCNRNDNRNRVSRLAPDVNETIVQPIIHGLRSGYRTINVSCD